MTKDEKLTKNTNKHKGNNQETNIQETFRILSLTLLIKLIARLAGTTAEGQNLLASISTSRASLLQGQYLCTSQIEA